MEAIIITKEAYDTIIAKLDLVHKQVASNSSEPKEKFIDNQEFLQLMKISKRTAQTWRDEGKIAFSQVGNKIYYNLADVEGLLKQHYNKAFARR